MTFEKSGSICTQRTTHKLILVDVVEVDEEIRVHRLILQTIDNGDLNKWKNINTHPIDLIDHHFLSYFKWLGNRTYSNIFNLITDYLPFVN
jgi:hypothetical protein